MTIHLEFHSYFGYDEISKPAGYFYQFADQTSKDIFDAHFPNHEYHILEDGTHLILCDNSIDDRVQSPDEAHTFTTSPYDIEIEDDIVTFISCVNGAQLSPRADVISGLEDYWKLNFIGRDGVNG